MKNYFLSLLLLAIFSSCDFLADPYVVGSGTISFDEHNGYTCKIDNMTIKVDSVLTNNTKKRTFTQPQEGQNVTLFLLSSKQYLYDGIASSQEIKKSYFAEKETSANADLNFIFLLIGVMFAYGYINCVIAKEKQKKSQQS